MSIFTKRNFIISTFAALFFVAAFGVVMAQGGKAYAAPGATLPVGVVDYLYLINNYPDTPKANEALRAEREQTKKEFEAKSAGLGDKEKQDFNVQLAKRVEQKRQELLRPISEKLNVAIKEIADEKGLAIVISKSSAVYGGVDITDEVMKRIAGK